MDHKYWHKINQNLVGFLSEDLITIPFFDKEVKVYLDDEYDEDWEKKEDPPTVEQLNNYAQTFDSFLKNIDPIIIDLKEKANERYNTIYAKFYEDEDPPLILKDKDAHFQYMKDVLYVRVSDDDIIRLLIHYDLDEEHGLEIKIQHNKVVAIAGIAET